MELRFKKIYPIFIIALLCLSISCEKKSRYYKVEGMIWNTLYHVTYEGDKALQDSILPILNGVGKSLSVFDENSLVSFLNKSDSLRVDSHFVIVYDTSKKINLLSEGNFDPTLSPLIDAWGFGRGHTVSPDTLAVDSILTFIGINKTHRNGDIIIKDDRRIRFNFSAIAKGYGCDAVGDMLRRNGVDNYMVEIGGELVLNGVSPSGKAWKIAIDAPIEEKSPGEETALIIEVSDCGVATSGNYRNYRIDNGVKNAHTISPLTGRPFIGQILSATVISSSCMESDALATACMASSDQFAKELLGKAGAEGLFIYADSIWMTPGFKKHIISEF